MTKRKHLDDVSLGGDDDMESTSPLNVPLPRATSSTFEPPIIPPLAYKTVWVVHHHSQERLAKNIVSVCQKWKKLAAAADAPSSPLRHRDVELMDIIQWRQFRDGFPNLFIKNVKEVAGKDVIFVASFDSTAVIFEQLSLMWALPRYRVNSLTVLLPYFPTGTMERVDEEGQIATANTLAQMLSALPLTCRGPVQVLIYDIHALQERFYFSQNVIPRLESAMPLLIDALDEAFDMESDDWKIDRLGIAFPDEGAYKRFNKHFPDSWPRLICSKTRSGEKRQVRLQDGDAKGRDILIVDDLVQTGGTLMETIKLLHSLGARSVNCYVTHAVFPQESWRQFMESSTPVRRFYITDSVPHVYEIAKNPPFKLLSLAGQVAQSMLGYDLKVFN